MTPKFFLFLAIFILLTACAPVAAEILPTQTITPVPSATPIPPTATPDLRVGGFIVLDGKIYAAADDGALTEQEIPGDVRVAKLSFSADNTLLALDESGAEVARFENDAWLKIYTREEIKVLSETEAGRQELLATAPEFDGLIKNHVHDGRYVAYKNAAGEFVSFYDLTGKNIELVDAKAAGFWTYKEWQELLADGKVQMGLKTFIEKKIVLENPENYIITDSIQFEELVSDNMSVIVLKSDGTVHWVGSKDVIKQMVSEGGVAITKKNGDDGSGISHIMLQVMNERYLNEKAKDPNFKPDKPWFVIGENGLIDISSSSTSPRLFMIFERDENGRIITPVVSPPPGLAVKFGFDGNMIDIPNVKDNPYWIEEVIKKANEEGVVIDPLNLQPNQLLLFFAAVAQ